MRRQSVREWPGHSLWRSSEWGQTTAEFVLVLSVFMLLVLGVVDFSRIVYASTVVAHAAREGARAAIWHAEDTEANNAAIRAAARAIVVGVNPNELVITTTRPSGYVQVDVSYTFHPIAAFMAPHVDGGSGAGFVLHGRSKMRTEE